MTTAVDNLLARLTTLCSSESTFSITKAPFAATLGGRTWTGATNGRALMLVDAPSPASTWPGKADDILTKLVSDWPTTGRITRAAVKAWVGGVDDPKDCPDCHGALADEAECGACDGTGLKHADCDDCQHDCEACDGRGTVGDDCDHGLGRGSYGVVTDGTRTVTIDRFVLAPILALMTGDAIEVGLAGPEEMLRFRGDGWRAAMMPVRHAKPQGATLTLDPVAPPPREA